MMLTSSVRVFIVFFIVAISGSRYAAPAFPKELDYSPMEIAPVENGWTAKSTDECGSILFQTSFPTIDRPKTYGDLLYVIEWFDEPNGGSMTYVINNTRLSAIRLSDGRIQYSTYLRLNDIPFIPRKLYSWDNRAAVYGFYQYEDGSRENALILFDDLGNADNEIKNIYEPVGIVSSKNRLISFRFVDEFKNNFIRIHRLPSGELENEYDIGVRTWDSNITVDEDDNVYLIRLNLDGLTSGVIEKYSIQPWRQIWTKTVKPSFDYPGYPNYLNIEMGLLWYGLYYTDANRRPDGLDHSYQWDGGPLDPKTGEPIGSEERFSLTRILHEYGGNRYVIEYIDNKTFRVKIEKMNARIDGWNCLK